MIFECITLAKAFCALPSILIKSPSRSNGVASGSKKSKKLKSKGHYLLKKMFLKKNI